MSERKGETKSWEDEFRDAEEDASEENSTPSSNEFAAMLDASLRQKNKKFAVGDRVTAEILVIGEDVAYVSLGTNQDGEVPRKDLLGKDGQLTYRAGQSIDLYVTLVKGGEVKLSTRPTSKNLADDLEDAFDMMLPVEGRVTEAVKGGVRVSLHGRTAFCPISQLSDRFVENPEEFVGKRLEFRITKFASRGKDIMVSRKLLLSEEKELGEGTFLSEHKPGDVVAGTVRRLEKFGAFIELAPGVEGLAHVSELSWSRVADPTEVLQVGQDVKVKFLRSETDAQGRTRIALSIKQAGAQPWDHLPAGLSHGAKVRGKVTRLTNFGAFVELAPGIEGLLPLGQMSEKRIRSASEVVQEGEKITVRILSLDPESRRISLSLKDEAWSEVSDSDDWRAYQTHQSSSASSGLGSLGSFAAQLQKAVKKSK